MAQQQAARQQTINDWAAQEIAGSFADSDDAGRRLKSAAENCHLIGGVTVCPMPEGYEVQIVVVPINKDRTYAIKGQPNNKGIGKSTLMTLATAAGVEWTVSRRVDDGRDPRFCHWHAEGRYPLIDGTWLASPSQARRELDRAGLYTDLTEEFPGADPVALSDALTLLATRWGL